MTRRERVRAAARKLIARGSEVVLLRPTVLLWHGDRGTRR